MSDHTNIRVLVSGVGEAQSFELLRTADARTETIRPASDERTELSSRRQNALCGVSDVARIKSAIGRFPAFAMDVQSSRVDAFNVERLVDPVEIAMDAAGDLSEICPSLPIVAARHAHRQHSIIEFLHPHNHRSSTCL